MIGVNSLLQAQDPKIGYTNIEMLLSYYKPAEGINQQLQKYGAQLEQALKSKESYFQTKYAEYQEKTQVNGWRSEDEKKAAEAELQKLDKEIQDTAQESEYRLMAKQQELMQPILDKIQEKINEVAKEGGFTYILNQTSGMNILYGIETMDVTDKMAAKLGITLPPKEQK